MTIQSIELGLTILTLLIILYNTIVIVGGQELAIVERRWFGQKIGSNRVIALVYEVGVQARTLPPGLHFLIPFLYAVKKIPFTVIGEAEVGLIESIDGNPVPPGRIFGHVVAQHDSFQNGEGFLRNSGQKGPQIETLPPGTYRINTALFKVRSVPSIVIESGNIGIVTAMDGAEIPNGRLLAHQVSNHSNFQNGDAFLQQNGQKGPQSDVLLPGTYRINTDMFKVEIVSATVIPAGKVGLVTALDGSPLPDTEFVAKSIPSHQDYQSVSSFLGQGGQRGPQLDVLKPGTYYLNPFMFKVELDDVARVERGQVAVVVSNIGNEPTEKDIHGLGVINPEHQLNHNERYVVPKGYRGIQREVAGPGIYYLNRRAFIAYIVDTTNITIDWDETSDTKFDPLKVISRDGFEISVSVKVIIRVRPEQAPYMVSKIGSIDNLINHVIHPMIDSSFRNQASSTSAMNFLQDRQDEQSKAETKARVELERYHVECVSVLICQIKLPQELMDTQTFKIIAQQQQAMYEEQQKAEQTRIATEKTRSEAELQKSLVEAEIGVKIAEQTKIKTIRSAEGESESVRIRAEGEAKGIAAMGEAEGQKILAIGEATAKAYQLQHNALSQESVTAIEVVKQIAGGNIKITPDFLIQGDSGSSNILTAFLAQQLQTKSQINPDNVSASVSPN
ncbi:hypothetical protein EB093_01445 [bacterium]|nr:hypothetical protein [bacterium]